MKVKKLMVKDILMCAADDPVLSVAKKMMDHKIGMLPVLEDNLSKKPIGVLSDQDIIKHVVINKARVETTTAGKVCTKKILSVDPQDDVEKAVEIMKKNDVKRVLVIDDLGEVVGILSRADIIKELLEVRKQLIGLSNFEL
jgi:CBS domain-containing protein